MKWKTKPDPKLGDIYRQINFAILPTELENGFTVWLEFYYDVYEYVEAADETLTGRSIAGWMLQKKVQKEDGTERRKIR